jgi:hypothetical protein
MGDNGRVSATQSISQVDYSALTNEPTPKALVSHFEKKKYRFSKPTMVAEQLLGRHSTASTHSGLQQWA